MTEWKKPRALRAGDLVGVCAPASAVEPEMLEAGVRALEAMGLRVRVGEAALDRHFFTAGTRARRLADLQGMLADPGVAAVLCARGGTGSGWLVEGLDPAAWSGPKLFVGYSDNTVLHLVLQRLGWVTVHGPMVAWELAQGRFDEGSWRAALFGEAPPLSTSALRALRPGSVEGRLRGGCLSLLAACAGTGHALQTNGEDTILFLEDVAEKPFRLDRMLLQLRQSGAFSGVHGVVFGEMKGCRPPDDAAYSLDDVLLEALDGLDLTVAAGLSSGHADAPNLSLPLGVRARLAAGPAEARLELLEPSVI